MWTAQPPPPLYPPAPPPAPPPNDTNIYIAMAGGVLVLFLLLIFNCGLEIERRGAHRKEHESAPETAVAASSALTDGFPLCEVAAAVEAVSSQVDMATLGAESEATVNSSEKEGKSEELMSGRHAVTTPIIAGTTLGYLGETDEDSSSNLALSREALSQSILLELHAAAKEEAGEAVVEAEEMPSPSRHRIPFRRV